MNDNKQHYMYCKHSNNTHIMSKLKLIYIILIVTTIYAM